MLTVFGHLNWLAILIWVKIGCRTHGSRHRLTITHVEASQEVTSVLALMQKCTFPSLLDLEAKEEGQLTNHTHLKLGAHDIREL